MIQACLGQPLAWHDPAVMFDHDLQAIEPHLVKQFLNTGIIRHCTGFAVKSDFHDLFSLAYGVLTQQQAQYSIGLMVGGNADPGSHQACPRGRCRCAITAEIEVACHAPGHNSVGRAVTGHA